MNKDYDEIEKMYNEIMGGEDLDDLDNTITLTDETGAETRFEFLELIDFEGAEYVVLLPCDDDADEVVILHVDDDDGEVENYSSVDDEKTLQAVFEIFKEKFSDTFNFVD